MKYLFLIPARGGSKGIPHKNIKPLGNKPLIAHTLEFARSFGSDQDICVSTDDKEIISILEQYNYLVPFIRPDALATDTASSYEVILHAIEYYKNKGVRYDAVVLLQPTSPFRTKEHLKKALDLFDAETDLVVSVQKARTNPYYALFKKTKGPFIEKFVDASFSRRQDLPELVEWNGAVYVINISTLKNSKSLVQMPKIKMIEMDELHSLDLDTPTDWLIAEMMLEKGIVQCG